MNEVGAAQGVCLGCCLNPGFINPFGPYIPPLTNDPFIYGVPPPLPNPNPIQFAAPVYVDNLSEVKLTQEETELLKTLGNAFSLYTALEKRSEADDREFVDALHRLQQIVALRVARRVNPEVWAQP